MKGAFLLALLLVAPVPAAALQLAPALPTLTVAEPPAAPAEFALDPPAFPTFPGDLAQPPGTETRQVELAQLLACLRWPGPLPTPPPVPLPLPLPSLGVGPEVLAPLTQALGKVAEQAGLPHEAVDALPRGLYVLRVTSIQGTITEYALPPTAFGPVDLAFGFPVDLDEDDLPDACVALVLGSTFDRQGARVWALGEGAFPGASVAFLLPERSLAPQDGGSLFALGFDGGVPSLADLTLRLDDPLRRLALSAAFAEAGSGHPLSAWRSDEEARTFHAASWSAATHGTGVRLVSEPEPRAARVTLSNTDPADGFLRSEWVDDAGTNSLGVALTGAHRSLRLALDDTDGHHLRARGGATPAGADATAAWRVTSAPGFQHHLGLAGADAGWTVFEAPQAVRLASSGVLRNFLDRTDDAAPTASVAWDAATGALDLDVPLVRHLRAGFAGLDADVVVEGQGSRDLVFRGKDPQGSVSVLAARATGAGPRIGWSNEGGNDWRFDADQPTDRLEWVAEDGSADLGHALRLLGPLAAHLAPAQGEARFEGPGYSALSWLAPQAGPWAFALLEAGQGGSVRTAWDGQARSGLFRTYLPQAPLADVRLVLSQTGDAPAPVVGPHVIHETDATGAVDFVLDLPDTEELTWDWTKAKTTRLHGTLPLVAFVERSGLKEQLVDLEDVRGPVEYTLDRLDLSARAWPSLDRLDVEDGARGFHASAPGKGFRTFDAFLDLRGPNLRLLTDRDVLSTSAHRLVDGKPLYLSSSNAQGASLTWPLGTAQWTFRVPGDGNATMLSALYDNEGDLLPFNTQGFHHQGPLPSGPWQLLLRGTDGAHVDADEPTVVVHASSRWQDPLQVRFEDGDVVRHAAWGGPAQPAPRALDVRLDHDRRFAYALEGKDAAHGSAWRKDASGTTFEATVGGPRAGAYVEGGLGVLGIRSRDAASGSFQRTGTALHGGSYDVVRLDLDGADDGLVAGFRQHGAGLLASALGDPVDRVELDLGPALLPPALPDGLHLVADQADGYKGPFLRLRGQDLTDAGGLAGAAHDAWQWQGDLPAVFRSDVRPGEHTKVTLEGSHGSLLHSVHRLGVDLEGNGTLIDARWCDAPLDDEDACGGRKSFAVLTDAQPGQTLSVHAPDRLKVDGARRAWPDLDTRLRVDFDGPDDQNHFGTDYQRSRFVLHDLEHDPRFTFANLHALELEAEGAVRIDVQARSHAAVWDVTTPRPPVDHLQVFADRATDFRLLSFEGRLRGLQFCPDCDERLYEVVSEPFVGPGPFWFVDRDEWDFGENRSVLQFPALYGLGALRVHEGRSELRTEVHVEGVLTAPVHFGYAHLPLGTIEGRLEFTDDHWNARTAAVGMAKWEEPRYKDWASFSGYPNLHMSLSSATPVHWNGTVQRLDARMPVRMEGDAVLLPAEGAPYVHGAEAENYLTDLPAVPTTSPSAVWNTCYLCIRWRDTNTHETADETRYVYEQALQSATLHADLDVVRSSGDHPDHLLAHYGACGWEATAGKERRLAIATFWDKTQERFESNPSPGLDDGPYWPKYFHDSEEDYGRAYVDGRWTDPDPWPWGGSNPRHILPVVEKGHAAEDHCTPTLELP